MEKELEQLLYQSAEEIGVHLAPEQLKSFGTYMDLLLEWNEKMNLTAITEPKEVVQKHFADCLTLLPYLPKETGLRIIDVGTGAGFPGLPVKIAREDLQVTLLDSLQKRITFLETVIAQLSLKEIHCIHARAEDGGRDSSLRDGFDCCVSRAVARMSVLAEYCLPFVKPGGLLIALKGPEAQEEVEEGKKAIAALGAKVEAVYEVEVPFTDLHHTLVLVRKEKPTPKRFPRKAGKAAKEPIV